MTDMERDGVPADRVASTKTRPEPRDPCQVARPSARPSDDVAETSSGFTQTCERCGRDRVDAGTRCWCGAKWAEMVTDVEKGRVSADRGVLGQRTAETDQCELRGLAGPSARRSRWYREKAAEHGQIAQDFMWPRIAICDPESLEYAAQSAREAAHYALLALEVEARRPCAICGGPDARHRMWDAIADRFMAGESIDQLAADYGCSWAEIEQYLREAWEAHHAMREA